MGRNRKKYKYALRSEASDGFDAQAEADLEIIMKALRFKYPNIYIEEVPRKDGQKYCDRYLILA